MKAITLAPGTWRQFSDKPTLACGPCLDEPSGLNSPVDYGFWISILKNRPGCFRVRRCLLLLHVIGLKAINGTSFMKLY